MTSGIPVLSNDTKYWFFRTEGGSFFDQFYFENFIAYGWDNFIDLAYIKETDKEKFKTDFKELYKEEKRPGLAVNQMKLFVGHMKINDIVFIPSEGSEYIAFGVIASDVEIVDAVSEQDIENGKCPYRKRRKVNWYKHSKKSEIDPYLFKPMCAINTITDATEYAPFIDRMIYPIYIKDGVGHLSIYVKKQSNISAREMSRLIDRVLSLLELPSTESPLVNTDEIDVRVNVQSPGLFEFIGGAAAIFALSVILRQYILGGTTEMKIGPTGINFKIEGQGILDAMLKHNEFKARQAQELRDTMERLDAELPRQLNDNNEQ